ncbi:MAG TPA: sulfite exporter TauE/SafE family protein [Actinomycetota bacterium]|nr:sulfite exporter TauE/SafE family protein [Actinomycetota bacterium]
MKVAREIAFEDAIEASLLGPGCHARGLHTNYDPAVALDSAELFTFIGVTQADAWEQVVERYGGDPDVAQRRFVGGLAGGLLPSPTAVVVLTGAVALHRVAFGLALVVAFSVGLATALTAVGALALTARDATTRRLHGRLAAALPVLSAAGIIAVGTFLTARAALAF